MSTHFNHQPLPPAAKPSKSWREKKWLPFAAVGGMALLVGMGIGGAGKGKPEEAAPAPAVTVTASPSPAPTVTKTVEKEVPVTPQACLKYITLSEQGFTYAGEAMGYMSEALTAASAFDVAGLTKASDKIAVVSPKMKALAPESNAAKAECKASAK